MKCVGAGIKELLWIGNALKDLPIDIKREIGFDLDLLLRGLEPWDFKPVTTVGKGTLEIRMSDDERNIARCFYVTTWGG